MIDRARIAEVPQVELARDEAIERGIARSAAFLASDAALRGLAVDIYWPKWDSPWWHMLLLHELGEAAQIPAPAVAAMVAGLDAMPVHTFPLRDSDMPPGTSMARDATCHCALGSIYQVLAACGVDVERALPWVAPWFGRYQLADGGLNCDSDAYLVTDECPSSMVGTVAPFEALLVRADDRPFLERGARFLIDRALMHGSPTRHNAEERAAAPAWRQLAFPRFYFYDVLRGLAALVRWAETTGAALPWGGVEGVVDHLLARFPDGVVRIGRQAHAGLTTRLPVADRTATVRQPVSTFPLLEAVSVPGAPSAALTRQWSETRRGLLRLIDAGRMTA